MSSTKGEQGRPATENGVPVATIISYSFPITLATWPGVFLAIELRNEHAAKQQEKSKEEMEQLEQKIQERTGRAVF